MVEQAIAMAAAFPSTSSPARTSLPEDAFGLSPREREVLHMLALGKSNPQIAEDLFIGRGTVRTHVSNILAKLGASTRTEAAMIARDRGLLKRAPFSRLPPGRGAGHLDISKSATPLLPDVRCAGLSAPASSTRAH